MDQNLSPQLVEEFPPDADIDTVLDEGLAGADDRVVAAEAARLGRVLITADRRFAESLPVEHPGLVVLHARDPSIAAYRRLLREYLGMGPMDVGGRIVVVEPGRVRVG